MTWSRIRRGGAAALVCALALLGACGDDDATTELGARESPVDDETTSVLDDSTAPGTDQRGEDDGGHRHDLSFGAAADPDVADRVVEVGLTEMAFDPATISVTPGEVVLFRVTNHGAETHEFTLGDEEFHAHHAEEMAAMADGHDHVHGMGDGDGNAVTVEPGETAELAWQFPLGEDDPDMTYVCHVPGHADAGMSGNVQFLP